MAPLHTYQVCSPTNVLLSTTLNSTPEAGYIVVPSVLAGGFTNIPAKVLIIISMRRAEGSQRHVQTLLGRFRQDIANHAGTMHSLHVCKSQERIDRHAQRPQYTSPESPGW